MLSHLTSCAVALMLLAVAAPAAAQYVDPQTKVPVAKGSPES
jgi:hypothetical protein